MCCQSLELDSRKDAKHAITYKKKQELKSRINKEISQQYGART